MSIAGGLGGHAARVTICHDGVEYVVRPLSFVTLSDLEMWMVQRGAEAQFQSDIPLVKAGMMSREELISRKDAFVSTAIDEAHYAFGGEKMTKVYGLFQAGADASTVASQPPSVLTPILKLFSLMLACDIDTAVNILSQRGPELVEKIKLVMALSVPKEPGADQAQNVAALPTTARATL